MRSLRYLPVLAALSALLLLGGPLHAAKIDKPDKTLKNPDKFISTDEAGTSKAKIKGNKGAPAQDPANPATAPAPSGFNKGGKASNRPAQAGMMDRRMERLKQQLGSNDEEWLVIKPLLTEVLKAQSTDMPFRTAQKMGGRKKGGGKASTAPTAPVSADPSAAKPSPRQTLSKILADGNAPAPEIKAQMDALRAEKRQKADALKAAREKLRPLLTVKQEATLLLQGYMD